MEEYKRAIEFLKSHQAHLAAVRIEVRYQGDFPARGLVTMDDVLRETGVKFKTIHVTPKGYLAQISNLYDVAKDSKIGQGKCTDTPSDVHVCDLFWGCFLKYV